MPISGSYRGRTELIAINRCVSQLRSQNLERVDFGGNPKLLNWGHFVALRLWLYRRICG